MFGPMGGPTLHAYVTLTHYQRSHPVRSKLHISQQLYTIIQLGLSAKQTKDPIYRVRTNSQKLGGNHCKGGEKAQRQQQTENEGLDPA